MKYLGGASLLLVLSIFGAAAQSGGMPVKPAADTVNQLPPRDRTDAARPMTLAEAIDLALRQASNFKAARFNEQIAVEDVRIAKAALYPRVAANPTFIYTTPSLSKTITTGIIPAGNLISAATRPPSFLGANAITEYQGVANVAGEIDTSGRLRATVKRNQALLESARAGSEIARRDLIQAVTEAYFNLALATVLRRGAEMNLQSATEFENNTKLQLDAGEVAPVDLVRARLQSAARRDELAQAQANESVSADSLRVFIGLDFTAPIASEDLLTQIPADGEIERYTETAIAARPEFAQFEADFRAARQEIKIARGERRPQITYSVNGGFISDSLAPASVKNSLGIQPTIGVSIPLFDRGASKARETQAQLRIQQTQNARVLAERQFAQAFFSARTQALSARSRIKQIAASMTDAEANVSASLARYRAGEASIVEVTDANNTLILQRQALYRAIFDYQTARARLLRAIGQ
ncbi:MAG: TolC family protein [Pyrinomonadaceae bacterium]